MNKNQIVQVMKNRLIQDLKDPEVKKTFHYFDFKFDDEDSWLTLFICLKPLKKHYAIQFGKIFFAFSPHCKLWRDGKQL